MSVAAVALTASLAFVIYQQVGASCPLRDFDSERFEGKKVQADRAFVPKLEQIERYAELADVKLHITSAFRVPGDILEGNIVPAAKRSNHYVGHAIDMNVKYGADYSQWCNSRCLGGDELPAPVQKFIDHLQANGNLRWGGNFRTKDVVHIDDALNLNDPQGYNELFKNIHENC